MILLHVFEETDQDRMDGHLSHWMGHPDAAGHPEPAVCYCGARVVALKRSYKDASDILVGGIWHYGEWQEVSE